MTAHETCLLLAEPFLPPLRRKVRRAIKRQGGAAILDVGGRHSPYTAGIRAAVTVSDLPRDTEAQQRFHLGIDWAGLQRLQTKRSNIHAVVFDDMTRSALPFASFDGVVAVEVLEHVEADETFVRNVARTLKPGGWFLMTTPNGDHLTVPHGDHKRHYRRAQLEALLGAYFAEVQVGYCCPGGPLLRWGNRSWSIRRPLVTLRSAAANLLSHGREGARDTAHHLFAVARHPYNLSTVIEQVSRVGAPDTAEIDSLHA